MSAVDFAYYSETYYGGEADATSFPALNARAEDIVGSLTRWRVSDDNISTFPSITQTLYKKAICAQIDYFAVNGTTSITADSGQGFTVGKVTVHDSAATAATRAGNMVCPLAYQYLEQSGLMGPQVPTAPDIPYWGCYLC